MANGLVLYVWGVPPKAALIDPDTPGLGPGFWPCSRRPRLAPGFGCSRRRKRDPALPAYSRLTRHSARFCSRLSFFFAPGISGSLSKFLIHSMMNFLRSFRTLFHVQIPCWTVSISGQTQICISSTTFRNMPCLGQYCHRSSSII